MRAIPALADVASDLQQRGLQAFLEIDRDAASRLGLSMSAIDNALYSAFGQRQVSTIFTQASQYRVVLEVAPEHRAGPQALEAIHVSGSAGRLVPLSSIARVVERPTALVINHLGQFPAATISFNLAPGASLGEAVDAIRALERELELPRSIQTRFQGAALAFQSSLDSTLLLSISTQKARNP